MRIVQHGPTWLLALDAPVHHEGPWMADHLQTYGHTSVPASQQQAGERGKLMRKARSRKKRHALLADLENRYLNAPEPLGGSFRKIRWTTLLFSSLSCAGVKIREDHFGIRCAIDGQTGGILEAARRQKA